MEFGFGEKEEKLRREIREFVKAELPSGWIGLGGWLGALEDESDDEDWAFAMSMSRKLAQKGWLAIDWPPEYGGGGASVMERLMYFEDMGYWGVPGVTMGVSGTAWVGPSLMMFGNEEQKRKYLPLIASGEPDGVWCTGYSEPNAGSDLANLQTRAIREGDYYVINGQKTWTSAAHRACWCWLAARTDPNAPKKHQGISLFIVDMRSPGVVVHPLLSLSGLHIFNEVFFDNVHVPVSNLVGEEHKGWYQLMSALIYERSSIGGLMVGALKRLVEELVEYVKETESNGVLLSKNPLVRQSLADRAIEVETLKLLAYHTAWMESVGRTLTYEPSRDKVFSDEVMERVAITGMQVLGPYSQVKSDSRWTKFKGVVERMYLLFPGLKIAAGADEIEKNVIAQFGLGLPRGY